MGHCSTQAGPTIYVFRPNVCLFMNRSHTLLRSWMVCLQPNRLLRLFTAWRSCSNMKTLTGSSAHLFLRVGGVTVATWHSVVIYNPPLCLFSKQRGCLEITGSKCEKKDCAHRRLLCLIFSLLSQVMSSQGN